MSDIYQNKYGRYAVPAGLDNRPAVKKLKAGKVYEHKTIAFLRTHAGTGDIIHAGTFVGDFLPGVRAAMVPRSKLWAFEPHPVSFDHARQTVALNALEGVELTNAALSDQPGTLRFRTHDDAGQHIGGLAHVTEDDGPGVETVPAAMLDYAVPLDRPISILQLDVEGHEGRALLGAYHLIHRWKPILVLEAFDRQRFLRRHFPRLKYSKAAELHGNIVFLPEGRTL